VQGEKMNKKEMERVVVETLEKGPLELDILSDRLYYEKGISELEVKEAVQRLRYRGLVKPNRMWEMALTEGAANLVL